MMILLTKLYLYNNALAIDYKLPNNIYEHVKYKIKEKREISLSNYYYLSLKLKELGLDIANVYFLNNKPMLKGLYLSISHTDKLYGFALSDKELGLDIEATIPENRLNLSQRILSNIELEEYSKSANKALYLTNKWTIKEAYSKYLGTGLSEEIFAKSLYGFNLELLGHIIGLYGVNEDIEIYLNNELINKATK